jgi:1,2-phenylacetyl-CoA epoxidase catalytic subunit
MTEYSARSEMPERYARTLDQMMKSQAYRELAAAQMFGHGLKYVPELKWLKFMTWHIREEMEHYEVVAKMYAEFAGESVEPWVHARLGEKPIEFAESWFELAMAQFLYDRGGFWQLQEYENASYPHYREVIRKIIAEEKGHQGLGERIVVDLCRSGQFDHIKQPLFEKWLRYGLLSFGRPGGEGNAYAISVGLKKRDSAEVMKDFIADIRDAVRQAGLRWPEPAALGMELPADIDWSV